MSLKSLIARLGDLADIPSRASRSAAQRISDLIQEGFDQGTDPYGRPWKPLAPSTIARRPWRGPPPLTDTGKMRDAVTVAPRAGGGVEISSPVSYSVYHQRGTTHMPARKLLPEGRELPEEWQDAIEESIEAAYRSARK